MSEPGCALLASYWGKADPNVALTGHTHHTVLGHSLDVAACAFVLIDRNSILCAQLAACTEIPTNVVALTFAAVCALHDVGKLDTRFQRKAVSVADALRPHTAGIATNKYDHGTEGFRQIDDDETASARAHALLGPNWMALLRAVCGHHGVLPSRDDPEPSRSNLPRSIRREDVEARRFFQDCVVEFFVSHGAALPWPSRVDGALVQRLGGLCAVADWLGSNVAYFPYAPGTIIDLEGYWARACVRAVAACAQSGLLRPTSVAIDFRNLFPGYTPRDVQKLTEQVSASAPALVVVEAEMGKGKTEAALSMAARFLARGLGEGITITLPTMATSNAMLARIEEVASRLFHTGDVQLALAHGRASRQPRFQALVQRGLRARDLDAPEASVMCARWLLNRKRILLAQIGVGTIDQALQAALVVRHQFVRMFGLSRNVVIVDEVHAYDAYMEVLIEHLLAWLGALDVTVILLSATLPSERRAALARAWRGAESSPSSPDDLETARTCAYPLVSVTTRDGTTRLSSDDATAVRTLILERVDRSSDESVASRLLVAARQGARVVWIRNTVGEAQRAFQAVAARAADVEHTLFHARFRGCDRSKIELVVLDRFGKSAPSGGRVLIATQVVEQSLDLDFDELHTDLAPVDLIFQRAGRLHRHQRVRLPGFERPRLVVHGPCDVDVAALRFGPSCFVYDTGTLWIADRAMRSRNRLLLPSDIRPLIEETYHPSSRTALLSLGGAALVAAEQRRAGILDAKRTKAKQCCIPPTTVEPDGQSALDDDDDAVQAFTRDGMSATIMPFSWDGIGARTLDADTDSPCWQLDAERGDAWHLATELMDQTLSLPAAGSIEGSVVSGDVQAWDDWQKHFARFADDSGLGTRVVPLPMRREGETYTGCLRINGKIRRVLYTPTLGLWMPGEKEAEQT